MDKKETGEKGEKIAAEFLLKKGYSIHFVNWRFGNKEIDIIAEINNTIIIIEVKSRTAPFIVEPELAVTIAKQKLLILAANHYLISKNIDKEVRFDIISIVFIKNSYNINHLEDAFYPKVK
jgi:putative endonuclease